MNLVKIKQAVLSIVLFALVILSAGGHIEKAASALGAGQVTEYSEKYLDDSFDKSLKGFLILSGIKTGLAIIEGSEIGVGFNLEVGDIVQSVYDYVDIAWRAALTGGTIIIATQLILQIVALMNHWCLSGLFALIFGLYLFHIFSKSGSRIVGFLKSGIMFFSVLTIALYLILPVSIKGAAYLSEKITNPLIEEAHNGFLSVKNDLSANALSGRIFPETEDPDESWMSKLNLNAQYKKTKVNLIKLGNYLKIQSGKIAVWTIKLIAGYLFDCLLFPLLFFLLIYIFVKFTTLNMMGIRPVNIIKS